MHIFDEHCYIGGRDDALDAENLVNLRITHILTLDTHPLPSCDGDERFRIKFVQIYDIASEDLLYHLDDCLQFMINAVEHGNGVLVHCFHGVSRSATVAVAYLMKKYQLSAADALDRLRSKRPSVQPNTGFHDQLVLFGKLNHDLNQASVPLKLYRLQAAGRHFKKYRTLDQYSAIFQSDPATFKPNEPVIRCKQCRRLLASKSNIISHLPKQGVEWSDSNWVDAVTKNSSAQLCRLTYFVEPIEWMTEAQTEVQGKLHCPKCSAKIGAFNWFQGSKCSCTAQIVPGFYLQVSRVDLL